LHAQNGQLPKEFARLFDEANDFQVKQYRPVRIKKIERLVPRELGDIIVNVPWYIRNMMRHGCERAHDFADRDFGEITGEPTAPLPGSWAYTPKPFDDHAYDVRSHAAECTLYEPLDIVCDVCPRTFVNGALDLLLPDALPQKAMLDQTSQLLCEVCLTTVTRRALAPLSRAPA
jgi:hypothetical protein